LSAAVMSAAMMSVALNNRRAIANPLRQSAVPSDNSVGVSAFSYDQQTTDQQTTTQPAQPQVISQFERIYVSTAGDFLGAHTIVENTALYIDRAGHVSLSARDYTAELDYDYRGRLQRIGTAAIDYDYIGRVQQIGNTQVDYDYRSRVSHVGQVEIAYTARGKVAHIGDVEIRYDRNIIDTISANFTSSGARVVVVSDRRT